MSDEMKLDVEVRINLQPVKVLEAVAKAQQSALRRVVVDVTHYAVEHTPVLTGTNKRSIAFEISEGTGRVFTTSGYGGHLEIGKGKMPARPYMKPGLDTNIGKFGEYVRQELGK